MTLDITVPEIGESITEATVTKWFKAPGDAVARDELLVELETDKVAVEINAASAGMLVDIVAHFRIGDLGSCWRTVVWTHRVPWMTVSSTLV